MPRADIDIFMSTLSDLLDMINNEKKDCILMGDFNIDLLKFNTHDKTNLFIDNIFAQGFIPLIHKPTRISNSSATLIDHMYTNNIKISSISGIIITDLAYHFGTFHTIYNESSFTTSKFVDKRIFSDSNVNKFNDQLTSTNFDYILQMNDPDQAYNHFMSIYSNLFQNCFPITRLKLNTKYHKLEHWMSTGLMASMKTKTQLLKKKLKQPTEFNINNYKAYINVYNSLKSKMKYYSNIIDENKHNMKKT